jgi:hypothetical protein
MALLPQIYAQQPLWRAQVRTALNDHGLNVRNYGAKGDSVTNDTAAFEAAIAAAMPTKDLVWVPASAGHYMLDPIAIAGADQGFTLAGEAWNDNLAESPETGGVILELRSASNDSLFTIDDDCAPVHFQNLFFRGNQAGQSSGTSWAVDFTAAAGASRSGTFHRCRFERWRSGGIRVGTFRDAGKMDLCVFLTNGYDSGGSPIGSNGDAILLGSCNDWRLTRVDAGASGRHGMYVTGAGTLDVDLCNFFSNNNRGIQIDSGAQGVTIKNGSVDRNLKDGIVITGTSSTTHPYVRKLVDMWFSGNGVETNNTYDDIKVATDPNGWTQIIRPIFNRSGSASNFPKYSIETTGTSDNIPVTLPRYLTGGNAPYATGFTNDLSKLIIDNNTSIGSGAPGGTARKGSLYLRTDGSTINDRAYINTDGGTTWTAIITAA